MNAVLSHIYGTDGLEKTAGADKLPNTLSDLALLLVYEEGSGDDLTKIASAQKGTLDQLVSFDRAGRAMAHAEFTGLEKAASDGNIEPLKAFFGDLIEEEPEGPKADNAAALEVVKQEIARRAATKQ